MSEANQLVFLRGEFVPVADAKISILTHALHYSTSCFEGIRCNWNEGAQRLYGFRFPEHYARLLQGSKILQIKLKYSVQEMCDITVDLVRRCGYQTDVYVRPLAYKSEEKLVNMNLESLADDLAIMAFPVGDYLSSDRLIRCLTSAWQKPDDMAVPSGTKIAGMYTTSMLAKTDALAKGFDEAILLNSRGVVSEGSGENLFMVQGGVLHTPPTSDNCLGGITRDTVITIAREHLKLEVRERSIHRSEIYLADEVFLCGTAAHVTPVGSLDNHTVGDGKIGAITRELQAMYFAIIRGGDEKYMDWCTPI